ncbi:MAG: nicotinamide-nucleotide amidohydrolase family protein [Thiohalophilus sp.]|uniref:CinA family protein n=1 Tax=Thiohalophilus sp. TaxID=3028392 RepID=UPI00287019A6|nr:nicotinamide-nucleotide amidohydrolase family protein [Thiohalophilus sp.]MDR9435857.1 nicotinamide-nucleotide amidohydrolase family protein [Thiohalophilus sp.]
MSRVPTDEMLLALAHRVSERLEPQSLSLATAESCTGGWIAKLLTDVPGCSAWFERGFVTYSNEAKQELLAVPAAVLDEDGAVSEPTVRAMAEGALRHSRADLALSVSGIAGPGGGRPDKPLGLVWFGWAQRVAGEAAQVSSEHQVYNGNRDDVRRQAVVRALEGILELTGE